MAKKTGRGFADKVAKSSQDFRKHCPVCGEAIEMVKHIIPVQDEATNSIRFKERMVGVCNCNRSEIHK
jgi:C4-type Zn-finger protein